MKQVTYYRWLACVWLLVIFVLFVLNLVSEDRSFSEFENRMLAKQPPFRVDRLLEGRYTSQYEKYVNDQFFLRQTWVELKAQVDLIVNQRENNGVYYASDDYLIEAFLPASEEMINQNLMAINDFVTQHEQIQSYFLMIPNAISLLNEKLPSHTLSIEQQDVIQSFAAQLDEEITFINAYDALLGHQNEPIYYKTDHHYTTLGAYYTFLALAHMMNLEVDEAGYEVVRVSDSFNGTLTSKSGYAPRSLDTIEIYLPKEQTPYIVTYVEEQQRKTTLYQANYLQGKDKYAVFLGGNHSLVKIETASSSEGRLLILKDSYANALIPFLIPYYEEIVIVDPRYYFDDLTQLIEKEQLTELLYVYNANTFFTDNSLNLVLNNE